jgi:hypothetical protein
MRAQGRAHLILTASALVGVGALGAGAPGCATRPAAPPIDNSLDRLLADADTPPTIEAPAAPPRARSDLEARLDATVFALEQALAAEPRQEVTAADAAQAADQPPHRRDSSESLRPELQTGDASPGAVANPAAEPVPLTDLPPQRLAAALAERLWADAATTPDPFAAALTLAFLERHFDLPAPETAGMGGPALDLYRRLTPGQRESLTAMRHLAHETLRGEARTGETGPVADVLDSLVFSLWDRDPVRIGRVALCEEVRRYGDYTELPSTRFLAGETARMVVYVELDRFTNIADGAGAGWKVDLSLEINIFSESGRTLVWRMAQTPYPCLNDSRIEPAR